MEIEKINKAIELIQAGNSIRKTAKILEEAYTTIRYYTYDYAIKRESLNYNRDFFETIDSEKKAYWLGYIAADGSICSQRSSRTISITTKESDYNHLVKYIESLEGNFKPKVKNVKYRGSYHIAYRVSLSSQKMYNDLMNKGIIERKSLTLMPPVNVPESLIKHWIRGYFDGDGSIFFAERDSCYNMSITGTQDVLNFINNFVFNGEQRVAHRKRKDKAVFGLGATRKKAIPFYEKIYKDANIYLERKKLLFDIFAQTYILTQ